MSELKPPVVASPNHATITKAVRAYRAEGASIPCIAIDSHMRPEVAARYTAELVVTGELEQFTSPSGATRFRVPAALRDARQ